MRRSPLHRDRHALYEASVQAVDSDLDLMERTYRRRNGRGFSLLREDFCGTAALACAWALRGRGRRAIGVDLDPALLEWCLRQHLARMGEAASRVRLVRGDVRRISSPRVDVVAALNFSWWVLRERGELLRYFRAARRSLRPGGLFFAHAFGGTEAMDRLEERTRVAPSQAPDGLRLPGFTYVWEQASFNPADHRLLCHIHFHFAGGRRMRRAFTYDWRLWTLAETRDAMREAGFRGTEVLLQGWNDRLNQPEAYRPVRRFRNRPGWLAFVVGGA